MKFLTIRRLYTFCRKLRQPRETAVNIMFLNGPRAHNKALRRNDQKSSHAFADPIKNKSLLLELQSRSRPVDFADLPVGLFCEATGSAQSL